jgi:hypothetical protein
MNVICVSPYATLMISHALKDNIYITDLFLGNNSSLLSTPDACLCLADLVQRNNIRVLDIKNTGVDDRSSRSLSQVRVVSHIFVLYVHFYG